jgi:hypothetical protein
MDEKVKKLVPMGLGCMGPVLPGPHGEMVYVQLREAEHLAVLLDRAERTLRITTQALLRAGGSVMPTLDGVMDECAEELERWRW